MTWQLALILLPGLLVAVTVHEFAHAWSASLLGDDYARRAGRVSLNPFRHLSPLGTLAIFLLPFGWGKPVMVNLYNFRRPKRDYLITSLAGPAANLVLFGVCVLLMNLTRHTYWLGLRGETPTSIAHGLLRVVAILNLILAVVNLIPIPPLDGSKIWPWLIPSIRPGFTRKSNWVFLVVLLVLFQSKALDPIIGGVIGAVGHVIPVADSEVYEARQEAAEQALARGDFAKAETLYGQAISINAGSDECYYGRALARAKQNNWQGAAADLDRAIALRPGVREYQELRDGVSERLRGKGQATGDDAAAKAVRNAVGWLRSLLATQPAAQPGQATQPVAQPPSAVPAGQNTQPGAAGPHGLPRPAQPGAAGPHGLPRPAQPGAATTRPAAQTQPAAEG